MIRTATYIPILAFCAWTTIPGHAKAPLNTVTIDNQSGQFAIVKVIGPGKKFVKIPLDQKRTVRVNPGEYYLLIRYGFSAKEYLYTKSRPFQVTESDGQHSLITFTLHRVVSTHPNAQQVSGEEFESTKLHDREK